MTKRIKYIPPSGEDVLKLKQTLNKSNREMAALLGVNNFQSFQRYTSKKHPLALSYKNCFYLAAKLTVSDDDIELIYKKMREIGAVVEVSEED